MLAFTIPDTRHFMALFLKGDAFDDFAFRQGEISAFAYVSIDGKRDLDYYDETVTEPWCSWSEIKPLVFQAVKGKKTPKNMKLVLSLSQEKTASFPNTKALFWNLLFREDTLLCTLSAAQESFSLDKTHEASGKAGCWTFARAMAFPFRKKINNRNFVSTQFD